MKKGAASVRAGGMDEQKVPWGVAHTPESHVSKTTKCTPSRGTGRPSRAQDRQLKDRASLLE